MRLNRCVYYRYMSTLNRATCVCRNPVFSNKNSSFGGNMVDSSKTNAMRYSQIVRVYGQNNGSTRYVNNELNAFGSYSGAPGGSRAPPKNSF